MAHVLQGMFVAAWTADDNTRMPFRPFGGSYVRDIFFDIKMSIKETYNSYTNHLSINVECNYIIKHHKLRQLDNTVGLIPLTFSKKAVLYLNKIHTPYLDVGSA